MTKGKVEKKNLNVNSEEINDLFNTLSKINKSIYFFYHMQRESLSLECENIF